jgi:hypothetical protein
MEMTSPNCIPQADWISCGQDLPDLGKFVWVIVGRIIQSGTAKRYLREVHMGVYKGDNGFEIHPFRQPMVSTMVWAWAPIIPPLPPLVSVNVEVENEEDE